MVGYDMLNAKTFFMEKYGVDLDVLNIKMVAMRLPYDINQLEISTSRNTGDSNCIYLPRTTIGILD